MLAKNLVDETIPALRVTDTIGLVMERMADLRVFHLPVTQERIYSGLISDPEISDLTDPQAIIEQIPMSLPDIAVLESQHVYEVIDLVSRLDLTLVPVINTAREYLGSITLPVLVKQLDLLTAAGQPGAILVLNIPHQDYSPTILARIIEENNAKIVSLYAVSDPGGRDLKVTIKINSQETSSIVRSFDRYGYLVESYFLASSQLEDFYRSRYEEFMKYMNI